MMTSYIALDLERLAGIKNRKDYRGSGSKGSRWKNTGSLCDTGSSGKTHFGKNYAAYGNYR